jgi:hypothetical protein
MYRVIASYQKPSKPMPLIDAEQLVRVLRSQGVNCHIEKA